MCHVCSKAIPLDENEGIYVRDIKTGRVRSVVGQTYMLKENEELWPKGPCTVPTPPTHPLSSLRTCGPDGCPAGWDTELPAEVEELLVVDALADRNVANAARARPTRARDKTQVVTYRVPHNAAIQIYDYKQKRSR